MKKSRKAGDVMREVNAIMAKIFPNEVVSFNEEGCWGVLTDFRHSNDESNIYRLSVDIDNDCELLRVIVSRKEPIPPSKEGTVLEFLNLVNKRTAADHFYINPETKRVAQIGGILVKKKFFQPEELEKLIRVFLGNGRLCFEGLSEVIQKGGNPLDASQKIFGELGSHLSR